MNQPLPRTLGPNATPWWLQGNYAPVPDEVTVTELEVEGEIPQELDGLYVRNGSNAKWPGSRHWFLGNGMVHGIRLRAGEALWYRNRFVQTPLLERAPGPIPSPPTLTATPSNVSLVHHAGKLLSLGEIGLPYELWPGDLTTIDHYDFAGRLKTAMTAHPKIDPETGELLLFGYGFVPPYLTYHQVSAAGTLDRSVPIDLPRPVMMHDFGVTARHVVFMDLPIVFRLDLALIGDAFPFRWDDRHRARLGVMSRGGDGRDVRWFEISPCFVFHVMNAYEEGSDVVLDVARYARLWDGASAEFDALPALWRYRLDLRAGTVCASQLDDRRLEMPQIDPRRAGRAYRYGYALELARGGDGLPGTPSAVLKYDHATCKVAARALHPAERSDEPSFVPASPGAAEDEGYLLSFVYDARTDRSQLVICDARDFERAPLARVHLPRRVPFGFHGTWVPAR